MSHLKFIHAADVHLDSPFIGLSQLPEDIFQQVKESTFRAFEKMIDLAINEKVDFIVISGDVYDGEERSLRAQLFFQKQMERLQKNGINAYVIYGNHDHTSGDSLQIDLPENVFTFSDQEVECVNVKRHGKVIASIYGFSYPERSVFENMSKKYERKTNAPYHIGLLHGSLAGERDHEPYCPFKLSDLLEKNFDYWALGHIHKRQVLHEESPTILYPGNLQGRHMKETGEKGVYLVEFHEKNVSYEFYPLSNIIFQEQLIDLTNIHSISQLLSTVQEKKEELRMKYEGTFCKLTLTGRSSLFRKLHQDGVIEEIKEHLNDIEHKNKFVWILSINNETIPNKEDFIEESSLFTQDFEAVLDQYEIDEALKPLYKNTSFRRFIAPFTKEEKEEIIREAKEFIFYEWLKNRN